MLLPTSEAILTQLRLQPPRDQPTVEQWTAILPGDNPHQLLYALQALENLSRDPNAHGTGAFSHDVPHAWADRFIEKGGFQRLYDLLMSPQLQEAGGTLDGMDHQRDCLTTLIRVIYLLCVEHEKVKMPDEDSDGSEEESSDDEAVPLGGDGEMACAPAAATSTKKRKGLDKPVDKGVFLLAALSANMTAKFVSVNLSRSHNQSINRSTNQLFNPSTLRRLIDWLIDDMLIDWDWWSDWLIDCLIDWKEWCWLIVNSIDCNKLWIP